MRRRIEDVCWTAELGESRVGVCGDASDPDEGDVGMNG
jgi:hypothetical protein